jgi:hypothetical protein
MTHRHIADYLLDRCGPEFDPEDGLDDHVQIPGEAERIDYQGYGVLHESGGR